MILYTQKSKDKNLINKCCKDADIVHHLAGITDVPRVKSETNHDKDNKIKLVAEQGTQNILDAINHKCKIIFPSTHVVYEGIEKVKNDILEEEDTKPILSYASSKAANEKQRAQGEATLQRQRMAEQQRLQQADVSGKQFVFGQRENREMQQLNRTQAQIDLASGAESAAAAAEMSAVGDITSGVTSAFGTYAAGGGSGSSTDIWAGYDY